MITWCTCPGFTFDYLVKFHSPFKFIPSSTCSPLWVLWPEDKMTKVPFCIPKFAANDSWLDWTVPPWHSAPHYIPDAASESYSKATRFPHWVWGYLPADGNYFEKYCFYWYCSYTTEVLCTFLRSLHLTCTGPFATIRCSFRLFQVVTRFACSDPLGITNCSSTAHSTFLAIRSTLLFTRIFDCSCPTRSVSWSAR